MSDDGSPQLFGTDGIRGRANEPPMTPEVALQLGRSVAHVFKGRFGSGPGRHPRVTPGPGPRPRIVIGKDTRLSNYMFETALQAGICSMGVDAVQLGVLPTPGIAFMTTGMRADAGAVISASHNPYDDNGIKFFGADGFKLAEELEAEIERLIEGGDLDARRAVGEGIGRAYRIHDAVGRYCVFLKSTFPRRLSLSGIRVVVDCAHGAGYKVAPEVLYELGAEVVDTLGTDPNGTNINDGRGSLHPEALARSVREHGADLGVALDGDADRAILCDEWGQVIDGDVMLALLGEEMAQRDALRQGTVVATVMSNLGLERALARHGVSLVRTKVGDRHVVEQMRQGGYNLGGEQSGHLVMLDHTTTGDGLVTALQVLALLVERDRPLSELAAVFERVPQVTRSLKVRDKPPIDQLPTASRAVEDARSRLRDQGRVLVRYSGTEPKARVMVEGDDPELTRQLADSVVEAMERDVGRRG